MRKGKNEETEIRSSLLDHIYHDPGVAFPRLRTIFKMEPSTLRYHLEHLERRGRIVKKKIDGKRCYFTPDHIISSDGTSYDPSLMTKEQAKVLSEIKRDPGIIWRDLLISTGLNRKDLSSVIKDLREFELIFSYKNGGHVHFRLASMDQIRKRVHRLLMVRLAKGEMDESTFLFLEGELCNRS